jgi:hypothetical protein
MEQPVLRLGLLGFTDAEKLKVMETIAQPNAGWPRWELVELELADAWCIQGSSVQREQGNTVRVRTLQASQPIISLNPSEITRPTAFTEPVPAGIEAVEIVNFSTPQLMRVGLQRFEAWLRPLRAQFALGCELISRERELVQGIYHVLDHHGKLLAIVNLSKWTAALLPIVRPVDFEEANWAQRPSMASDVPAGFVSISVAQLMWSYAVRTTQDVLPLRYKKDKIYLRKLPNLPLAWLRDEHLVVLRALSSKPVKFVELAQMTQIPDDLLARALAALYFAGSITTKKSAAGQFERVHSPVGDQSSLPPETLPSLHMTHPGHLTRSGQQTYPSSLLDMTAPAPLFDPKQY